MAFGQNATDNCLQEGSHVALINGLPDEISILCLARVPRRYHHILRCVSRKWRALLCSEEWHYHRQKNNMEETWIYVMCRANLKGNLCYVLDPDPANRSWKLIQPIPSPCSKKDGMSVEALGKKLYLLGGCSWQEDATDEVYCYDASANKWDVASSMPTARCFFVSASLDDKLYISSGLGLRSTAPNSWDIYHSDSDSWISHKNPLHNHDIIKLIALEGKLCTIHKSWDGFFAYAGIYDPASATWQGIDNEIALSTYGPTVVVEGVLYMLQETSGMRLMKWQEERKKWVAIGRLSSHLTRPPCHLVAIGRSIYVIGQRLSTVVIDVDEAAKVEGLMVSSSFSPRFDCDHTIISCNTITI
ncbi:hypothetical protein BHE74_00040080 [Ensete ventricosum]|uniref:F-box domain-containing protein n=1 Tax=Ensete ventricosum TaxID=4639 RepID=A0A426XRE8_ENSVE|nr:hypothetical protein B296_00054922 [Ensete ventricosum]RWW53429.1 hypothetical protein BHE74_00040080 [Ensete ventricosum]RZS27046.1 hypothetical protein BHM03_00060474 [Ensete ventricosum]